MKSTAQIAEKWARVTQQRAEDYVTGVSSPRTPWAQATAQAADRYKAGVTEAIGRGAFEKGVKAAGDGAYQKGVQMKGPQRFVEGVSQAAPDFQAGFEPYAAVIQSTQLPPRFNRGDPRNLQRVAAITTALRKKKTG